MAKYEVEYAKAVFTSSLFFYQGIFALDARILEPCGIQLQSVSDLNTMIKLNS